eukprot:3245286-Prymnesium_polylepis.2
MVAASHRRPRRVKRHEVVEPPLVLGHLAPVVRRVGVVGVVLRRRRAAEPPLPALANRSDAEKAYSASVCHQQ